MLAVSGWRLGKPKETENWIPGHSSGLPLSWVSVLGRDGSPSRPFAKTDSYVDLVNGGLGEPALPRQPTTPGNSASDVMNASAPAFTLARTA